MKIYGLLVQSKNQRNALNNEGESISASLVVIAGKGIFRCRNSVTLNDTLRPLVGQEMLFEVSEQLVTYETREGQKKTEWQLRVTPVSSKVLVDRIMSSQEFPIENLVKFAEAPSASSIPESDMPEDEEDEFEEFEDEAPPKAPQAKAKAKGKK